jgi:integrase
MSRPKRNSTLLIDCLEVYLHARPRIAKDETRAHYARSLRQFGQYLGHAPTLADLTDAACAGFMQRTVEQGFSEVTANQRVKQIRAFWLWAARKRLVEAFPEFQGLAERPAPPKTWEPAELDKLLTACAKQKRYIGPIPAALFWLAYHRVALDTAEHHHVILRLRWDWFSAAKKALAIPGEQRKDVRPAVYPLSVETCELLEQIRYPLRDLIFDCGFGGSAFFHRYRRLVAAAGLPMPRGNHGPTKLRSTALAMIAKVGRDAWPPAANRAHRKGGGAA